MCHVSHRNVGYSRYHALRCSLPHTGKLQLTEFPLSKAKGVDEIVLSLPLENMTWV